MARTVLVHVNVTLDDGDPRRAEEVGHAISCAIEVGSDDPSIQDMAAWDVVMSEEI